MIARDVKNPFHTHMADDTVTLPAGDVPELHAGVLAKCQEALAQARHAGHSAGLLMVGEAGSGKSHLLARLRQHLAADPAAVLVTARMGKAYAGRLWRHLRERLVEELLRQYPEPAHGANGLLRILRNRFPKWAASAQGPTGGLLDWLVGRSRQGDLAPHLDEFSTAAPLDYGLRRVLPQVSNPELTAVAHSWLAGKQLGAKDLERLGLPPVFPSEQEQEVQAQDVVLSFLHLAGEKTTLVICFDEVEAIQAGAYDAAALRQFATLVTSLLAERGPRVVITSIRPNLQLDIQKAVEVANVEKMSQLNARIPALTWEQAVRVTLARLEAEPSCEQARRQHASNPYWPLGEGFVKATFEQNRRSLTPRHLIVACQVEFERLRQGRQVVSPVAAPQPGMVGVNAGPGGESPGARVLAVDPPAGPAPDKGKDFLRLWDRERRKNLERLLAVPFDAVMAIGLPWLVRLFQLPFAPLHGPLAGLGDVNLVFQPAGGARRPLGISLCNHPPPTLWRRLDRLKKQWAAAKGTLLGGLVLLRSEAERTTQAAVERLDGLKEAGARVLLVAPQQLAELAAFQTLLTAALEGDLTRNGKPVEAGEYDGWVKENLSDSVKELLDGLLVPGPATGAAAGPRARPAVAGS